MKRHLICIAAIAVSAVALAQQSRVWSLGDCIEYALENNLALKNQEVNVDNRRLDLESTQFSRLPNISGSVSESYNIGRSQNREGITQDRGSANTSIGVNGSVTVFQGMRIHNQAKADKLSLEAATQDLEQARQDLSINITALYLQVLYAKEAEAVARKQVEISMDLLEKTRKMVDAGRSSQSEAYDAESSLAAAQSNLVDAVNTRQTAVLDLAQAINHYEYNDFDIEVPVVNVMMENAILSITPIDTIYNDYIERRPSVLAAQKRLDMAKRNVKVAQSGWWPSINVGASYNTGYYSAHNIASGNGKFWDQLSINGSPSIGVSLSVPIFDRLSTHYSVKRARNAVMANTLSLAQEKQTVYKEVQQAYVNAKAAFGKYEAGMKSCEAAQKAFEFEQKKYENGRSSAYQFNEVRNKLANAEAQLSQAKYSFILRAKILDFYKGEPLY